MTIVTETSARAVERVLGQGKAVYAAARARSAALAEVGHPALVVPLRILAKDGGVVVAHVPHVDGVDVATLLASRGYLRAGECVTLGTELASALAALHSAGLAHGDISATNVMIADGRVVLVDTIAGAGPQEAGTAPYCAPERIHGATPACDMYSLGVLLRECVQGGDRDVIDAWTQPLVEANPDARPGAAMVARALASCAPPEPLAIPAADVASAMRSRAQANRERTIRLPVGRGWRARKSVQQGLIVATVLLAWAVSVTAGLTHALASPDEPSQPHYDPVIPAPAYAGVTPGGAGEDLTVRRFEALSAGDGVALLSTTAPTGSARDGVASQAALLDSGALEFHGLAVDVVRVDVLADGGNTATVAVSYDVAAHRVVVSGEVTEQPAYQQEVILDLTWLAGAGWQVEHARPRS